MDRRRQRRRQSTSIVSHQNSITLNELFLETLKQAALCLNATLDLLLSYCSGFLVNCEQSPGFGDHDTAVLATILCHPKHEIPAKRKIYCWKRANLYMLHQELAHNLDHLLSSLTDDTPVDTVWLWFKKVLLAAQDKHVPSKLSSSRYSKPWVNRECKRLIRQKNRWYKNFKRTNKRQDWENFQKAARTSKKACTNACNDFIKTTKFRF